MKLIIDIPEDTYIEMRILSDCGLGSDAIKYILNGTPLEKLIRQIKEDINDEAYCRNCFTAPICDYNTKIINVEDVFKIIDNRLIKE